MIKQIGCYTYANKELKMLAELNNSENLYQNRYLLVNNLIALNPFHPLSKERLFAHYGENKAFGEKKLTQVLRTDLDYDPSVCPTLVRLAEPDQFLERPILDIISKQTAVECFWSKRYISAYIVTELKPSLLAKKLVDIGNHIAKTLQQKHYYPFFEPFRMQFLHELGSNQDNALLNAQFSEFENIYYPSVQGGKFIRYTVDDESEVPISWSHDYCQRLKNLRMIRTLVNAWGNNRKKFDDQKNIPLSNEIIVEAEYYVDQAYQLGLTDAADILFWGLNGLRYHKAFTLNPNVLEHIPKAIKAPGTLSRRIIEAKINIEIKPNNIQ